MKIKPIRTDPDHRRALRDVDRLRGAEGTPKGDALDVLYTLVNVYEEHVGLSAYPIEAIRFRPGAAGQR